jgi:hypothetical protein
MLTPGNTDDRQPVAELLQRRFGQVFGDRGYVSQKLAVRWGLTLAIQLLPKLRRKRKNCLMVVTAKLLLGRRAMIESVTDQLKNIAQIEHSLTPAPSTSWLTWSVT